MKCATAACELTVNWCAFGLCSEIEVLVRAHADAEKSGKVLETEGIETEDTENADDSNAENVDLMYQMLEEDADGMELKL